VPFTVHHKTHLHIVIGFKSEQLFLKIIEKRKPERLFMLASDDVISSQNPNNQLVCN